MVITSWQVLAVTAVLVIYIFIINYVARIYINQPRKSLFFKPRKKKKKTSDVPTPSESDELILDEEVKE